MRRKIPLLLIAAGAALICAGFAHDLSFAGLPFPDPTPEMQARWEFHKSLSDGLMSAGLALLALGILWHGALWALRRSRRRA